MSTCSACSSRAMPNCSNGMAVGTLPAATPDTCGGMPWWLWVTPEMGTTRPPSEYYEVLSMTPIR